MRRTVPVVAAAPKRPDALGGEGVGAGWGMGYGDIRAGVKVSVLAVVWSYACIGMVIRVGAYRSGTVEGDPECRTLVVA
eukprot:366516-Rhodomonas_salina.1